MLHHTVKIGQAVDIPGVGRIILKEKSGRCAKLAFDVSTDQEIKLLPIPGADRELVTK